MQAASGALFLNNSAVTVYDSLFDSNRVEAMHNPDFLLFLFKPTGYT